MLMKHSLFLLFVWLLFYAVTKHLRKLFLSTLRKWDYSAAIRSCLGKPKMPCTNTMHPCTDPCTAQIARRPKPLFDRHGTGTHPDYMILLLPLQSTIYIPTVTE